MSDGNSVPKTRCYEYDGTTSNHPKLIVPISSVRHSLTYSSRNICESTASYHAVYCPRYGDRQHFSSALNYNYPSNVVNYNITDFSSSNTMMAPHSFYDTKWNRINISSPLTASSAKGPSILKALPEHPIQIIKSGEKMPSSTPQSSATSTSNAYIDSEILEAAQLLNLPPGGQKYSVAHWKGAIKLCYRWKTTTNEKERRFYRSSTTTNSLSASTLKSIKFFCDNILKRKSKRRQFAIHWKESGLKKLVEETSSSENVAFGYNDPKLETIVDDYFSGRTRSNEYNKAKEKVLEDRQKEIIHLWKELMNGPEFSNASSYQKLYLIQLAIEKPYRNEKVKIKTMDQNVIHDVAIEGYGGESYWEQKNTTQNLATNSVDEVLPVNEAMIKRFWKCTKSFQTPERQVKRRRIEDREERKRLAESDDNHPQKGLDMSESTQLEDNKENEILTVAVV